jgi:hypothetical protein
MQPSWKRSKNSLHQSGANVAILEFKSLQKHFFKTLEENMSHVAMLDFKSLSKVEAYFLQVWIFHIQ